jgi:hypothetical protein
MEEKKTDTLWVVRYKIPLVTGLTVLEAGPWSNYDIAENHLSDIATFEGVREAEVVPFGSDLCE